MNSDGVGDIILSSHQDCSTWVALGLSGRKRPCFHDWLTLPMDVKMSLAFDQMTSEDMHKVIMEAIESFINKCFREASCKNSDGYFLGEGAKTLA